jgi:hypothetical protein
MLVKKTLLILSLALSCYSLRAQFGPKIEFGLKAGLNAATLTDMGGDVYGYSSIGSVNGGALLNIKFSDRNSGFSLQPEAVFSGQGGVYSSNNYDGFTYHNYTTHLTYLNIPVLLQYQFRNGFRLETGPQFGVLLNARETGYGEDGGVNVKRFYKTSDFSWAFGGGFISHTGFGVDARFNLGLSDINNDTSVGNDANINNDVFQIGIFYQFGHYYSRY